MSDASQALRILMDLTRDLTIQHPLEKSLQAVTDASLNLVSAEHASIRLFDETSPTLLCGARSGQGTDSSPVEFRPGEGIIGWVAERGQTARVNDTQTDDRFVAKADQGFRVGSVIAVPLWASQHVVGVLAVSAAAPNRFSERHELLMELLANCTVPLIERATLHHLAVTDHQTKAYNQRYLLPRLRDEIRRASAGGTSLSVLLLDIDDFKPVNDTYGHAEGDRVLSLFTDRVRDSVRGDDVLVRRGGDEFVLIMPHTGDTQALKVAERIREAVAGTCFDTNEIDELWITVTIGMAAWTSGESAAELERRADRAMYAAKDQGRNRVVSAESHADTGPATGS